MILNFLQGLLAFIIVLGPLVFFHELGHFLVAKAFGIGVPVFSIGFGPRLFGFRRAETDYRVSAIPLGGYVRLKGDEADEERKGEPDEFLSRPKWQRFFVFVAGATFNIILAFVALWVLFAVYGKEQAPRSYPVIRGVDQGSPAQSAGVQPGDKLIEIAGRDVEDSQAFFETYNTAILLSPNSEVQVVLERDGERMTLTVPTGADDKLGLGDPGWRPAVGGGDSPIIGSIMEGEPAERAGLREGDKILAVDDREPISQVDAQLLLAASPDRELAFKIERNGETLVLMVVPRRKDDRGWIGVGFRPPVFERQRLSIPQAATESVRANLYLSRTLFLVLKRLITREVPLRTMSGPIGIAQFARQALITGPDALIYLLGFFSLQLGILNLLPIPVLDGGHILILGVEGLLRRELSERIKERVMQAGFVFLLAFMGVIIYLDIAKL